MDADGIGCFAFAFVVIVIVVTVHVYDMQKLKYDQQYRLEQLKMMEKIYATENTE